MRAKKEALTCPAISECATQSSDERPSKRIRPSSLISNSDTSLHESITEVLGLFEILL